MPRYPLNLPAALKSKAEHQAEQQGVSLNQFILWALAEKVGQLEPELTDPRFPGIMYRRGSSGVPRPVLRGTNLRVQTLVIARHRWGWSVAKLASEYDLSTAVVAEALAFYETHKAEIDTAIQAENALAAEQGA